MNKEWKGTTGNVSFEYLGKTQNLLEKTEVLFKKAVEISNIFGFCHAAA